MVEDEVASPGEHAPAPRLPDLAARLDRADRIGFMRMRRIGMGREARGQAFEPGEAGGREDARMLARLERRFRQRFALADQIHAGRIQRMPGAMS